MGHNWLRSLRSLSQSQFMSIEICGICRYYYCTCIAGSKVIAFATSAIFEIIALKTAGQVEGEFWLAWLASQL